jgi:carbamoyl-phosphate synthase small subunit
MQPRTPATLTLEDGTAFGGLAFGDVADTAWTLEAGDAATGELCFNTSMTGYQEILTDPSYAGQLICFTTPHIGNVGVSPLDMESAKPWVCGVIARDITDVPCNYRSAESLGAFLSRHRVPAIVGVDTRALTQHLRTRGAQRGILSTAGGAAAAREVLRKARAYGETDWVSAVSTQTPYEWDGPLAWGTPDAPSEHLTGVARVAQRPYRVVVLDCGVKRNILRSLVSVGCAVTVVPCDTSAAEILARKPDGIVLSNGPGDPEQAPGVVRTVRALLDARSVPILGICLGHQMLALALGAKTFKLKFGHRGGNHPVKNLRSGSVEMTAQNHGYAVDTDMLASCRHAGEPIALTHINLNDGTCEGFSGAGFASVQYHPEAAPGPLDAHSVFTDFARTMDRNSKAVL